MQTQKNNDKFTAQPQRENQVSDELIYGEANLEDAKISGYTDESGRAKQMAKPDVEGSPTGAFTDIGAGRSSVVKPKESNKTLEDAPKPGAEQAP